MDKRFERLLIKYGGSGKTGGDRPAFSIGPRRGGSLGAKGKPKDMKASILRLIRFLAHERTLALIAIVCAIVHTISTLTASYMLRPLMNRYIYFDPADTQPDARMAGLVRGLAVLAVVYAISVLTQWLQQRLMLTVSQRTLRHMRKALHDKLQRLPVRYFDATPAGDVMSRFTNDVDTIGEMLNTTLIQIISGAITIAGTVVLMLYTNLLLGTITIVLTPLLVFVSRQITKRSRAAFSAQQKNLSMVNGYAEEMISGQKVVKLFGHEAVTEEEFTWLNDRLCASQIRAQFQSGIMGPVTHQLCNVIYALVACIGGVLVVVRNFDIGGLTISLNFTRQFNRPINEISMQMNTVFAALAGAERVFEVLDQPEEAPDTDIVPMKRITGHVVLDNVSFGYVPGVTVLHNISLYAKPGQKIAFVGSTGAGKTTVTNLLSRFYELEEGQITIDGVPLERIARS